MISLSKDPKRILWERADVLTMSRILGADAALQCKAPPVSSIVKLAARKGIILSSDAKHELEAQTIYRAECVKWKDEKDGAVDDRLAAKFFPHQRADLAYIRKTNLSSYLIAHETGVGKTLIAIRTAEWRDCKRIALITPNAAKDQWRDEIIRWRDRKLPIRIVEGSKIEQARTIAHTREGWCIGHLESLVHAREAWLDLPWDMVIVDEAQFFQNRNAKRTEVLQLMQRTYAMALSAHPFTNSIAELFPILQFLYPALYPSFWRWAHMHINIEPKPFGGVDLLHPRRPNLLAWEMAPFTLRRAKRDVWPDLPPVTRLRRTVTLRRSGQREYEKLKKQFFVELRAHAGERRILAIPSVMARLIRLRQYVIDPGILKAREPSVKYPAVLELIDEIGKPVVIFTVFREAAKRLKRFLKDKGKRVDWLVGGQRRRVKPLKKKFLRGDLDALIVLVSVGGTSLNFGKYGFYIDLDLPWSPRDYEQTEGRVDRPEEGTGKLVATTGYRIIVKGSFEEHIEQKLRDKHVDFTKVFTVNTAEEIFGEEEAS